MIPDGLSGSLEVHSIFSAVSVCDGRLYLIVKLANALSWALPRISNHSSSGMPLPLVSTLTITMPGSAEVSAPEPNIFIALP